MRIRAFSDQHARNTPSSQIIPKVQIVSSQQYIQNIPLPTLCSPVLRSLSTEEVEAVLHPEGPGPAQEQ